MALIFRSSTVAVLAAAMITIAPSSLLAASSSKTDAAKTRRPTLEKQVSYLLKRKRKLVSGSPYICTASGFGHRGRCVLSANAR
jgi:hypothetical protein